MKQELREKGAAIHLLECQVPYDEVPLLDGRVHLAHVHLKRGTRHRQTVRADSWPLSPGDPHSTSIPFVRATTRLQLIMLVKMHGRNGI